MTVRNGCVHCVDTCCVCVYAFAQINEHPVSNDVSLEGDLSLAQTHIQTSTALGPASALLLASGL